jgi:hypothetical protein
MDAINRQSVLDLLNGDWAEYVPRFQAFSPTAQATFLEAQGYKRLADLLGHIVAWWEEGLQAIQRYRSDPDSRQPDIDVDSFNARAVENVREVNDAGEIRAFEEARRKFAGVIQDLSDDDFKDERILNQIKWELVNHLEDHRIR